MEQKDYRLAAIMYTDIAGFSRMMEKDEAATLDLLRFHNELIGEIVKRHHGTIIKTIGDALLVDFKNTVEALQSALEIQDKLYAHNKETPDLPLLVRIGVHLGDIYFFENDALGEGINIAARLQSLARPGCICFSQDVYNLVLNKLEFRAEKLGKVSLKNITKEIHAYEITTPNVEFDPDKDRPRPGYKPGSYLGQDGAEEGTGAEAAPSGSSVSSTAPASSRESSREARRETPRAEAAASTPLAGADRSYTEEGSRSVLAQIRAAILQDIKAMGRRITVDEARARYGYFGVEAEEVIATMTDQGLLARAPHAPRPPEPPPFMGGFASDARGDFDPNALSKNISAAIHGVVDEIEKSVERSMSSEAKGRYSEKYRRYAEKYKRHAERHAIKEALARDAESLETGKWDKKLMEEESWKPGAEELSRDFQAYRTGLEERCRKTRGGFIGNLTSFLAVNGFLWFLNLSTSAGFLWAAIVSAAWGIGLLSSAAAARRAGEKLREIEGMPALDGEQLEDYKKLNRVKDSIALHGATAIGVPFLLGLINFLTGPSFLWFLIPSAAIALSFFSHLVSYGVTKPRLEKKLMKSLGVTGGWRNVFRHGKARREEAAGLGAYAPLYREAAATKDAIMAQIQAGTTGAGSTGAIDAELGPSLDQYVGQVRLLAQSANEIDRLVEAIPMTDLGVDKAALVAKEAGASSESLKAEYRKSIAEIEKQEKSYQELKEQSEVIRLRLGSSVNQLKQTRLDLARIQAAPGTDGASGLEGLRKKTEELSRYLEDLRSSYDETRKDPFAELEELERQAEERKKLVGPADGPAPGGKRTPGGD